VTPIHLEANISETAGDRDLVTHQVSISSRYGDNRAPIGNGHLGMEWSRDRCRHVTLKVQGRDPQDT